jgi:multiple sugar transport system substrate-binding protein
MAPYAAHRTARPMSLLRTAWPVLLCLLLMGCAAEEPPGTVVFWAMGSEGEAVQRLLPAFERLHPGLKVKVQQIPWSAAHEKLLTAYAGGALPDVFQLGNTWIPEFAALSAIEPVGANSFAPSPPQEANKFAPTSHALADYFPGILATHQIEGQLRALPWYVDTRVLFYRKDLLAQAGFPNPPRTWREWTDALARLKARPGAEHYALLLPMNEWQVPALLGLQQGAALLRDGDRYGDFQNPAFRRAFGFYGGLFREGYAPAAAAQAANLYQEFAQGYFAMFISGPWNIGELKRRLPPALQGRWATAPLPAPELAPSAGGTAAPAYPGLSLAGGASLALSSTSRRKADAWKLIAFLSAPEQQAEFYRLTGDLPARRSAWNHPALAESPEVQAFKVQLERLAPTPRIPEWERIATKLAQYAEKAARGELGETEALAHLDAEVDHILEKRRWLLARGRP